MKNKIARKLMVQFSSVFDTLTVREWERTRECLAYGRAVISNESHWTKGVAARRADGTPCNIAGGTDVDAVCWCSVGAVQLVVFGRNGLSSVPRLKDEKCVLEAMLWEVLGFIVNEMTYSMYGIVHYNDHHTNAEVLAVWDLAIEAVTEIVTTLQAAESLK